MPVINPVPEALRNTPGLSESWSTFQQRLNGIAFDLAALPNAQAFSIRGDPSGRFVGTVTVADLKRKFDAITWSLGGNDDSVFANGGVGAIRSEWKNGRFGRKRWMSASQTTSADDFAVYASHPRDCGLIYLALHETAHVTDLGLQIGKTCWNLFLESNRPTDPYDGNSPLWCYNEAVANSVVRSVCRTLAYPELENPGAGYVQ